MMLNGEFVLSLQKHLLSRLSSLFQDSLSLRQPHAGELDNVICVPLPRLPLSAADPYHRLHKMISLAGQCMWPALKPRAEQLLTAGHVS